MIRPSHHTLSISALALVVAGGLAASAQAQGEGDINTILQGGSDEAQVPAAPVLDGTTDSTASGDASADQATTGEAPADETSSDETPTEEAPDDEAGDADAPAVDAAPATDAGAPVDRQALPYDYAPPLGLAETDTPSLTGPIRVDQEEITTGQLSFREIMEIGRHLFTQRYTAADGYGEGPYGPRETKRREAGTHGPMAAFNDLPWMRINGLDSQSCLECHSVSGMDRDGYAVPGARNARADGVSGAGTIATSAIINPMQQTPAPAWVHDALVDNGYQDPDGLLAVFLRNPPHVFGAGYAQSLAEEMSFDLLDARYRTLRAAADNPGVVYEIGLESKGTSYGVYAAAVRPDAGDIYFNDLGPCGENPQLDEYCGQIDGVGEDFVVRPFQWKGIASNMRNFVRDALNFHFAMDPVELAPGVADRDGDGVPNEVSVGEVTALTSFALSTRPPVQVEPDSDAEWAAIERGRSLFLGETMPAGYGSGEACASCHHEAKTLWDPFVRVHDPRTDEALRVAAAESSDGAPALMVTGTGVGLGQATPRGLTLPVEALFAAGGELGAEDRAKGEPEAKESFSLGGRPLAYLYDLSFLTEHEAEPLAASLPRLPEDDYGIQVPLYSDLKRHSMGRCLADLIKQQTDREGVFVPRDEFLTRPLWGVGDTGPWMHDGRALSLRQAIEMHSDTACVDDGSGLESAANGAVRAFEEMSWDDQEALVAFLRSLRLPREFSYDYAYESAGGSDN